MQQLPSGHCAHHRHTHPVLRRQVEAHRRRYRVLPASLIRATDRCGLVDRGWTALTDAQRTRVALLPGEACTNYVPVRVSAIQRHRRQWRTEKHAGGRSRSSAAGDHREAVFTSPCQHWASNVLGLGRAPCKQPQSAER
jgi:hypothetical protein